MPDTALLKVEIGFASDKGVKEDNEDFFGSIIPDEPQLTLKGIVAAIADGMSGSEDGKLASQSCVRSFLSDYYSTPDSWSVTQAGQKIFSATNSWLYSQGKVRYQSTSGMVSTLTTLVFKSTTAHLFHIGDCRIYRLRNNNLEQLTRDHRIWVSKDKNYLNRAMGIEPRLEVDYRSFPLENNDLFLMTTDGIHDFIDDKTIKKTLGTTAHLTTLAEILVQLATANNSDDNITCQLIRITQLPAAKEDEVLRRHANLPFPPPLAMGAVLDGYRIEEELHASKRTQIYRATDTLTNRQVILKTPSILYDDDTHYIEHFLYEEWAGKRLNHDNVVKILNDGRRKTCMYYVTEYLGKKTLRDWMKAYPKADFYETRKIIEQVAKGIRAFHRKEMLHQDIKPENIMIDPNGVVKIIDFGSVKIAGIAEIAPPLNQEGENILGTLNYTAPEYHLGQTGTPKSDLYAIAVITYEMLNGALPFGKEMPEKPTKNSLANLTYIPSFHHNPMVPIWVDGALKKATSITPQLRHDELSEFLRDLNHPNPRFMRSEDNIPLIRRNPLRFWQTLSGILLMVVIVLSYLLAARK